MCDCCERSLDEIYESYWDSVATLIEQGLLPKDFVEKKIKETMRQASLTMKLLDGEASGKTVTFKRYSPLQEAS